MKMRNGFVSNSSSASFVVMRAHLNLRQVDSILNLKEGWDILEQTIDGIEYIKGNTMMDNFGIEGFMERIGARNVVIIESDNWSDGDEIYDKFASNVGEDIGNEDFWQTYGERELDWKQIARRLMAVVQFSSMELSKDLPHHPASLLLNAETYAMQNWQFVHKNMKSRKEIEEDGDWDPLGIKDAWKKTIEEYPDLTPQEIAKKIRNKRKRELEKDDDEDRE